MVLEHLFPEDWLEKKHRYAFLLAVIYSWFSIFIAVKLFGANSGIVSTVFTALFLMPYLKKLLWREEVQELRERSFSLKHFWLDNKESIQVYFTIFFGIYFAFIVATFFSSLMGADLGSVFREQLAFESGLRGAAFHWDTFASIFMNNWWVLLACFLLSLVAGDGALFFIAWNASTWGAIFGFRALGAASAGGAYGPLVNLFIIVVITLPHVFLEGGAYILAAISGGVISDDVVSKRGAMGKFVYWFLSALILFVIFHYLFSILFVNYLFIGRLLDIVVVLVAFHFLAFVFDDPRHKEVFQYNYYLFLLAIAIFIIGAIVESLVLGNSTLLQKVYMAAFGF